MSSSPPQSRPSPSPSPGVVGPNVLSTTAGDLQLAEYHLRLEQQEFRILHTGAIISHADEQRFLHGDQPKMPYGIVLWPAAIALAHEIATRPFAGLRVLELGAGTGLPGIVAAARGAHVVQTDRQDLALHALPEERPSATRSGSSAASSTGSATGRSGTRRATPPSTTASSAPTSSTARPCTRTCATSSTPTLAPGGTLLLSDPFRSASFPVVEAMAAEGWNVSINKWTVSVTAPERAVGVFVLTRS